MFLSFDGYFFPSNSSVFSSGSCRSAGLPCFPCRRLSHAEISPLEAVLWAKWWLGSRWGRGRSRLGRELKTWRSAPCGRCGKSTSFITGLPIQIHTTEEDLNSVRNGGGGRWLERIVVVDASVSGTLFEASPRPGSSRKPRLKALANLDRLSVELLIPKA